MADWVDTSRDALDNIFSKQKRTKSVCKTIGKEQRRIQAVGGIFFSDIDVEIEISRRFWVTHPPPL